MGILGNWWRSRSVRERKILSIGLLIGAVYLLVSYVFDPLYFRYNSNKQELEAQKSMLRRYEHLIRNREKVSEQLARIDAMDVGISEILLSSPTTELASAEFQGLIKNLAQRCNISFTRISPQKPTDFNGYYGISLSTPFRGTIQQIQQFLFELESTQKLIHIDKLEVRSIRRDNTNLRVELEVTAYIAKPADSGKPGDDEETREA
ncbi:type II secretion system protein M [bacterium]|nr:type II secretion system protein M [candidate division CSSED10-310 bacterium]